MVGTSLRRRTIALAALACAGWAGLCAVREPAARADGLHCSTFGGESVLDGWKVFSTRVLRQVFPGQQEAIVTRDKLGKRTDPMWRSPAARSAASQAVSELILILEYVDPYNYAPDSPPWMATQEQREQALDDARGVLREIGRAAAFPLWEALGFEMKVEHDAAMVPYREFRTRQRQLQAIRQRLEDAVNADDAAKGMKEEVRKLQERSDKAWTPFQEIVRQIGRAQQELGRRDMDLKARLDLQSEVKRLEVEKERIRKGIQNETDRYGQKIAELNEGIQTRLQEIIAASKTLPDEQRKMGELQATLARSTPKVSPMIRRGDLFALDPMMCPRAEFADLLREILADLGVEALPVLDFAMKAARGPLKEEGQRLRERLKQPKFLPALAAALGDDEQPTRESASALLIEAGLAAFPALIEEMKGKNPVTRKEAHHVLRTVSRADIGLDPEAWAKWLAENPGEKPVRPKDPKQPDDEAKTPARRPEIKDDEPDEKTGPAEKKAPRDRDQRLPEGAVEQPPERMPEMEIRKTAPEPKDAKDTKTGEPKK